MFNTDQGHIENLRRRNELLVARNSVLQTRLFTALDALDAARQALGREAEAFSKVEARLRKRLRIYEEATRVAESDREDMQDAVLKLIEKVEHQGFSSLPHNDIWLSSPADPLRTIPFRSESQLNDNRLTYASSIIRQLQQERDTEREAHARTRSYYEERVSQLQARLSRREADLERCTCWETRLAGFSDKQTVQDIKHDTYGVLESLAVRNRSLEAEVKALQNHIQQPRRNVSSKPLGKVLPAPSPEPPASPVDLDNQTLVHLEAAINNLAAEIDDLAAERQLFLSAFENKDTSSRSGAVAVETDRSTPPPHNTDVNNNTNNPHPLAAPLISPVVDFLDEQDLDTDDGERSMELASPLVPTTHISPEELPSSLTPHGGRSESPPPSPQLLPTDPSVIELPPSPPTYSLGPPSLSPGSTSASASLEMTELVTILDPRNDTTSTPNHPIIFHTQSPG